MSGSLPCAGGESNARTYIGASTGTMRLHRVWIAGLLVLACGDPSGPGQTVHDSTITEDQTWRLADSPHLVRGAVTVGNGATLTIEAGATVLFDSQATLTLGGRGRVGTLLALGSAAVPITMRSLQEGGRPGPGSTNLTISGAGGDAVALAHSPIGSIPPGQYTGNARDRIWINEYDIRQDDTWHQRGVPYYLAGLVSVGDAAGRPTLTIEPGVTVISAGVRISVGETEPGAIHAVGTEAEPIVFTGVANRPGSWTGIVVGYFTEPSTVFDHVVVDNGGGQYVVEGSFHFYTDLGPVIRNSTIRNSASCGVIIVNQPPWSTDFTAPALGNTFTDNARGAICGP